MYIERTNMASVSSLLRRTLALCFIWCVFLGVFCVEKSAGQTSNETQAVTAGEDIINADDRTAIEKGMDVLFDMTNGFLTTIQTEKLTDQSWLNLTSLIKNQKFDGEITNWQNWLNYSKGYAACIIAGLVFFFVMPIFALFFCCCRICGNCGGKAETMDPPRAKCKRTTYCSILLIFNTIMLAGVVCAFVSNDLIHARLQNNNNNGPIGKLSSAFSLIENYVDSTVTEISNKTLTTFDDTREYLVKKINSSAADAVEDVANSLNATSLLNQAEELAQDAIVTQNNLNSVLGNLSELAEMGGNLSRELTDIKQSIQNDCNNAKNGMGGDVCGDEVNTTKYNTDANYSGLSNMSDISDKVLETVNMSDFVKEAKDKISEIKKNSTTLINEQINSTSNSLDEFRDKIKNSTDDFKVTFKNNTVFFRDARSTLNSTNSDVQKYSDYIYYGGIGVCCVYLLIVLLYYLGVLYGMCGERPGHDAPCCNKGMASNFLMAGVGFSFLFSWLLMLLIMILFIIGGPFYTEVCQYFVDHDPSALKPFSSPLMKGVDLKNAIYKGKDVDLSLVSILEDCKSNKAVYPTLKLENVVNVSSIIDTSSLDEQFDTMADTTISFGNITLLSEELRNDLIGFGLSGLDDINFTTYETQMNKKLVTADLTILADALRNASANVNASHPELAKNLTHYADRLVDLDKDYVQKMDESVKNLNDSLNELKKNVGIENKTNDLLESLNKTEHKFNEEGTTLVTEKLKILAMDLKNETKSKIDGVLNYIKEDAGKCRPIYDSVYMITDSVCVSMLNPVNGFWFSMGWCIFFFIPCIIFALLLTGLYRREEVYEEIKDFDEPNFASFGGGPHHDTMPLTSFNQGRGPEPGIANSGYHRDDQYQLRQGAPSDGYPAYGGKTRPDYPDKPTGNPKNGVPSSQQYDQPRKARKYY